MRCIYCNLKMDKVITTTSAKWGNYKIVINGLPAYQCNECGEKIFSSETVDIIQNLVAGFADNGKQEKPEILNITETVDMLRGAKQMIYNMLKDGRLNIEKVGGEWRFNPAKLRELLDHDHHEYTIAARGSMITENDAAIIEDIISK